MKTATWRIRIPSLLVPGLLVLSGISCNAPPRCGPVAGSVSASRWRDSCCAPACDGAAGGERYWQPDGLRAQLA